MADGNPPAASGSGGAPAPPPVIIPNTVNPAKSSAGAAAGGKPKMIFKPVVPIRKREPAPAVIPPPPGTSFRGSDRGRGRGGERGRGGRGRGRGGAAGGAREVDPNAGMTASGVFSMGPSQMAGRSRSSAVRTGPSQFDAPSSTNAPSYKLPEDRKPRVGDEEEYSDQEAGVEIVDMADLETLDVMAPTALRREKEVKKESKPKELKSKGKALARVKAEPGGDDTPSSMSTPGPDSKEVSRSVSLAGSLSDDEEEMTEAAIHAAQALDLDEDDEPEDIVDVRGDFIGWEGQPVPDNQFYFFQFPKPFPKFLPTPLPTSEPAAVSSTPMDVDAPAASTGKKGVSFAADVKMESSAAESKPVLSAAGGSKKAEIRRPEGQIGELVTTKKGRVKMRLGNGILYDVNPGSDLEFLQHLVHLDSKTKRATPIAEAKRRFIVTPDMDRLLALLAAEPKAGSDEAAAGVKTEQGVKTEAGLQAMQLIDED